MNINKYFLEIELQLAEAIKAANCLVLQNDVVTKYSEKEMNSAFDSIQNTINDYWEGK